MVSEIWFCSASLEFFHHGTAKGGGKHSVLLLRRREEVVHIPKVVTHTRTSHQHVEQTVEVPRKKKQHFFLSGFFLEENMSAETSNGFWDWQGMFFFVLSGITSDLFSSLQVPVPMQQEEQVHVPKIMTQTRPLDENDMFLIKMCHNHFSFEQLCSDEDSHHESFSFLCGMREFWKCFEEKGFYIDCFILLQLHLSVKQHRLDIKICNSLAPATEDRSNNKWNKALRYQCPWWRPPVLHQLLMQICAMLPLMLREHDVAKKKRDVV